MDLRGLFSYLSLLIHAIMPTDNFGNHYEVTSAGRNAQGNSYDHRDYGSGASNQNSYHYSNNDGSYHYSNSDGSTYHNDGQGGASYTKSDGSGWTSKQ